MSSLARAVLVVVAIVGGALALNVLGPSKPDVDQYDSAAAKALLTADLNEENAEGAPQQAVVNGWVARDLAVIQIDQNNDLLDQQAQTNQLLFVGLVVGALFLALISSEISKTRGRSAISAAEVAADSSSDVGEHVHEPDSLGSFDPTATDDAPPHGSG